ncbi:hypothetical protein GCM10011506_30390 [Marivirga lumbricoides]|uniref:Glycosyltransferase 2-like domain-containing protein n=1 Tax=Marivirga lumbricoides TaxID=1046115 RepID=A0ABQ1MLM9_9BACT|nr:hypothetical protein GCM10011506_30390 [Marivirga lumbricoides]
MNCKNPSISVIIPAYNVEKYIKRCLDSILNQTYQDFEILIYNDGSKDKTSDIISTYSDNRIHVYHNEENKGVVHARNFLLDQVKGDFIMFQDADDWSHPERMEKQIHFLTTNSEYKACGTQFIKTIQDKEIEKSSLPVGYSMIKKAIPQQYLFLPGTLFLVSSILQDLGYFNSFFQNDGNEDLYWSSKIVLNYKFKNLEEHLYYYELNINSITKTQVKTERKFYIHQITERLLNTYLRTGTNLLEKNDKDGLNKLENKIKAKFKETTSRDDLFEKQIGQIIYFKQYKVALRIIIFRKFQGVSLERRIRLAIYVIKRSVWK